jgi:hypothetical protein
MNIYEKLLEIQTELKCGKTQYNSFGNYYYRNCEDILEAIKPLCKKNKVLIYLTDEVELIGDRTYVKATATAVNVEKTDEKIVVTASAREEDTKKGMDPSQITGASSSYARKYALNGLLDIDDTKDSDATNKGENTTTTKGQVKTSVVKTQPQGTTKPLPAIDPSSEVTFGKHKGKTWAEMFIDDKTYFDYIIKSQKDPNQAQRVKDLYNRLEADNAKFEQQAREAAGDYKTIDTDYVDNFEQVLIQERTAN